MKRILGAGLFYILICACSVHHNPKENPQLYSQKTGLAGYVDAYRVG